jgi:transcriptional antiterminator
MKDTDVCFTTIDESAGFIGRIRNLTERQSRIVGERYGDHVDSVEELATRLRTSPRTIEKELKSLRIRLRGK